MLPTALRERPDVLADLGFTYDAERGMFYHQGTEYGRRKAEPEEVSLEKFTNYLDVSFFMYKLNNIVSSGILFEAVIIFVYRKFGLELVVWSN
jgi:hypothetical protein